MFSWINDSVLYPRLKQKGFVFSLGCSLSGKAFQGILCDSPEPQTCWTCVLWRTQCSLTVIKGSL